MSSRLYTLVNSMPKPKTPSTFPPSAVVSGRVFLLEKRQFMTQCKRANVKVSARIAELVRAEIKKGAA